MWVFHVFLRPNPWGRWSGPPKRQSWRSTGCNAPVEHCLYWQAHWELVATTSATLNVVLVTSFHLSPFTKAAKSQPRHRVSGTIGRYTQVYHFQGLWWLQDAYHEYAWLVSIHCHNLWYFPSCAPQYSHNPSSSFNQYDLVDPVWYPPVMFNARMALNCFIKRPKNTFDIR